MFPIVRRARFARVPASSASRIEHFCAWKDIAVVQPLNDRCASLCTGRPIKWNPIEHSLFSEISKNWAGEPLDSYQKIFRFIRIHQNPVGSVGHRAPGSPPLSDRRGARAGTASGPSPPNPVISSRTGTTQSHPICELVFARALSVVKCSPSPRSVRRPFANASFTMTPQPQVFASSRAEAADRSSRFHVACTT